jgi:predicted nucleic acid-binding protein
MKVIVDTSVWSLALRRKKPVTDLVIAKFTRVITAGRVILPGVIRQEILSGIPDRQVYEKLRVKLTAFPDYPLNADDYETAAEFFNTCAAMEYRVRIPIF